MDPTERISWCLPALGPLNIQPTQIIYRRYLAYFFVAGIAIGAAMYEMPEAAVPTTDMNGLS